MQHPGVGPAPESPIGDGEREIVVARIRQAMLDELIPFDAIDARFEAIYAANTRAELAAVTQDLPQLAPPSVAPLSHPIAPRHFSVFGDIKQGGDASIDADATFRSVFGSVLVDLSAMRVGPDGAGVTASSVVDDVTVIVPDGYRVAINARTVFGSTKDDLSPPLPGAATIHVNVASVLGDTKVFSLSRVPEGRLRRMWNSLRGRSKERANRSAAGRGARGSIMRRSTR